MKNRTCRVAWTMILLALTAIQSLAQSSYEPYTFTTLAGNAGFGSADGRGSDAQFGNPTGVAVDSAGNVYVSDYTRIRMVKRVGADWVVTTLAGLAGNESNADGTGSAARFFDPFGVAVDSAGLVYVADTGNNTIRKGYAEPVIAVTLFGMSGADFRFNGGQFGFMLTAATAINALSQTTIRDAKLTNRRSRSNLGLSGAATAQKSDGSIVQSASIKRDGNLRFANQAAASLYATRSQTELMARGGDGPSPAAFASGDGPSNGPSPPRSSGTRLTVLWPVHESSRVICA